MSYLDRLYVKIVNTVADQNGRQTQIRYRRHLTESPISNRRHSKQQCGKKQWSKLTSSPFRHLAESKDFWTLQKTHQYPGKVIIAQRAGGFYRLIVADRGSPESTIDVDRN